jgi:glycosyltransferase 2 family protein
VLKREALSVTLRALLLLAAALVVFLTFRDLELDVVLGLLSQVPPLALAVLLLPQLLALTLESSGWSAAFAVLGSRVHYLALLRLRLATEALALTLPGGVVWAESVKPSLLERWCRVPLCSGLAGMGARKYLLVLSQGACTIVVGLLGFAALQAASPRILGVEGLGWLVLLAGSILVGAAQLLRSLLSRGALAAKILALLLRLPSTRLRAALLGADRHFVETDGRLKEYFGAGAWRWLTPLPWFAACWLLESLETFLILRCLGVDIDFRTVAAFEVSLSFARNVLFVLPNGLGLNDLGYVTFLSAAQVSEPLATGAAFMILKRGKEAFWALIGYALLAAAPSKLRLSAQTG